VAPDLAGAGDFMADGRAVLDLITRNWLTRLSVLLLALFAVAYVQALPHTNRADGPDLVGHDYLSFYAAGRLVLEGTPEKAYDRTAHVAMQLEAAHEAKGGGIGSPYAFAYPPTYLTVVAPFAALPYGPSFALWILVTGLVYVAACWRILPDPRTVVCAMAAPVALCTLFYGQNAYLTAGLMGFALWQFDRRPLLAGLLIGILSFKPQLGLAFPLVILATGRWRVFAGAVAGVLGSVALSVALFGVETWQAVIAASGANRDVLLDNSSVGYAKMVTTYAALRYFDVSALPAYAVQAVVSAVVAVGLIRLWRGPAAFEVKAAGALAATILLTPFALPYDLMVEAPAIAFLAANARRSGWARGERPVLALVVLSPVAATFGFGTPVFLAGLAGAALLFGWTLHRAGAGAVPAVAAARQAAAT
jgi:alpha-1,2-mannosyltransferase